MTIGMLIAAAAFAIYVAGKVDDLDARIADSVKTEIGHHGVDYDAHAGTLKAKQREAVDVLQREIKTLRERVNRLYEKSPASRRRRR
jgi:hypothetical protein